MSSSLVLMLNRWLIHEDHRYLNFMDTWGYELAGGERIGTVFALPIPPEKEEDSRFFHVEFTAVGRKGQRYNCMVKFKIHDLYLIAFKNARGDWFLLRGSGVDIGPSTLLPLSVTHASLLGGSEINSLEEVCTSRMDLINAVATLSELDEAKLDEKLIAQSLIFSRSYFLSTIHLQQWLSERDMNEYP